MLIFQHHTHKPNERSIETVAQFCKNCYLITVSFYLKSVFRKWWAFHLLWVVVVWYVHSWIMLWTCILQNIYEVPDFTNPVSGIGRNRFLGMGFNTSCSSGWYVIGRKMCRFVREIYLTVSRSAITTVPDISTWLKAQLILTWPILLMLLCKILMMNDQQ